MIPPNRLEISPRVRAVRVGPQFAVKFPFNEEAKRLAWHGPGAHWDPGMKSWCMKGNDVARVMEVMEQIHGALVAAGKDKQEDRDPKAWVDWSFVPSALVLHDGDSPEENDVCRLGIYDDEKPGKGEVLRLERGYAVIEKTGDPFVCDGSEPGAKREMAGRQVCRVWHRPASAAEIETYHARLEDDPSPGF